jgi:hypothetical protein
MFFVNMVTNNFASRFNEKNQHRKNAFSLGENVQIVDSPKRNLCPFGPCPNPLPQPRQQALFKAPLVSLTQA